MKIEKCHGKYDNARGEFEGVCPERICNTEGN